MTRLYRTLAYRRRYLGGGQTGMRAAGLGVLMQRVHRITKHADYFWRFADDAVWLAVPVDRLDRLPLCLTRNQVERLLGVAR